MIRFHVQLQESLAKDLDRLAKRWGLNRTNTIRHLIARAVEEMDSKDKGKEENG